MEARTKKGNVLRGVALSVLVLSLAGNIIYWNTNRGLVKEKEVLSRQGDETLSAKKTIDKEYSLAVADLERYKGKNNELDKIINVKNKELGDQKEKIDQLAKQNASIPALKKQLSELRQIREDFEAKINQLIEKNSALAAEIEKLRRANSELNELYAKIEAAKKLKAYNITVKSYKIKRNDKQVPTVRAKKTERISVDFDIAENILADAGARKIGILIRDDKGMALLEEGSEMASTATAPSQSLSNEMSLFYNNNQRNVVMSFDHNKNLKKGKYTVDVYVDGLVAGSKTFTLK